MPRIFTRRRDSFPRRSNASLPGSRSSLNRYGCRRASLGSNQTGSQFSLRRPSMNNGSSQSSSNAFGQQSLCRHQAMQQQSKQNAVWNIEDQGSVSHPPSLVPSDTSVQTEENSLSRSSSQSSFQPPIQGRSQPPNATRYDSLRQYYAIRRATLENPNLARNPGSPRNQLHAGLRSAPLQHPANRSLPGSPGSFLPQASITQEETWGQFVDTADAEEQLARRRKLLSLTRTCHASLSQSAPTFYRLRRN